MLSRLRLKSTTRKPSTSRPTMLSPIRYFQTKPVERVIVLGAAGRDFFDFMATWSKQANVQVVAFTATQIPGIENRRFPAELCNHRYPDGLDIWPESKLEECIQAKQATTCALAYSDLPYETIQHLAARVNAAGCKFVQLAPSQTWIASKKPVVAVCATRTGVGKSQTSRYIARYFKSKGLRCVACRHPMPYDENLVSQRCQRFACMGDMDKYRCTIEEREEYYEHIRDGTILYAGVDYERILTEAEKEADIVLWDGGNNDAPFFQPDLLITLVDSLRGKDQQNNYYPGEINTRLADIILLSKVNPEHGLESAQEIATMLQPLLKESVPVLFGGSTIKPEAFHDNGDPMTEHEAAKLIQGKRVLVVDDGPTLTHGGMAYGAGYVLAQKYEAAEIVDPRPYAQGSLVGVFEKFTHLKDVLPAMGYGKEQMNDLKLTIENTPFDTLVIGTPSDFAKIMGLSVPSVIARYELDMALPEHEKQLHDMLDKFYEEASEKKQSK